MLDPKEYATQLVEKYKPHVNPYIGSSMLSDSPDEGTVLWQAKNCALIDVQNTIDELQWIRERTDILIINVRIQFHNQVKEHIKQL